MHDDTSCVGLVSAIEIHSSIVPRFSAQDELLAE